MNNCHEVERFENLMYEGCESHWHWISAKDRLPKISGWYFVYAPGYKGGSSTARENHNGMMFAKWSGKAWSIERCYYNRPDCVKAWMNLPDPPKEEDDATD